MTSLPNPHGYSELDITLLKAGAPTRFETLGPINSPVALPALIAITKAAMRKVAETTAQLIYAPGKFA